MIGRAALVGVALASATGGRSVAQVAPQAAAQAAAPAVDTNILPPQSLGAIQLGEAKRGKLEAGDWTMSDGTYADVWYFTAEAGQRVVIEMISQNPRQLDPYVQLLDPWGGKLGEGYDPRGGRGARITHTFREAGRFQIVCNSTGDAPQEGVYTLAIRTP